MRHFVSAALCAVAVLASPVFVAPALAADEGAAARLAAIASHAAEHADVRYAFTVDFQRTENDDRIAFKARYDPRVSQNNGWRLIDAAPEELDKKARKAFEELQAPEKGDEAIVYDKLGEALEKAELREETDAEAVFVAPIEDEDNPDGVMEIVIRMDKAAGHVSRIDIQSTQKFKPMAMVRVDAFRQTQFYAPSADGGPARLSKSEGEAKGKAFFNRFDTATVQTYSDIEIVDPA